MRKALPRVIALILALVILGGCSDSPSPANSPSPEASFTRYAEPEAIALPTLSAPIVSFCADDKGNIWVTDQAQVRKIDASGADSVFAEERGAVKCVVFADGRLYVLNALSEIAVYDENGNELERYEIGVPGCWLMEPMADGYIFVSVSDNPPVSGLLYNTGDRTYVSMDDRSVWNTYPMGNGEVALISQSGEYSVLRPAEGMKPVWSSNANIVPGSGHYDRYAQVVYSYLGGSVYAHESASAEGVRLLTVENPAVYANFRHFACAGDKLYVLTQFDGPPVVVYVFDLAEARRTAGQRKTLTICAGFEDDSLVSTYINLYMRNNPNVDIVRVSPAADDVGYRQFFLDLAAGTIKPDVIYFQTDIDTFPVLDSGLLRDLNDFPELRDMMASTALIDGVRELCVLDGALFGIPAGLSVSGYIVNRELFAELGLDIPGMSWTLEDFLTLADNACRDMDGDGKNDIYFPLPAKEWGFPESYVTQSGGYRPVFNTPGYISYTERLFSLIDRYGEGMVSPISRWPEGNTLMSELSFSSKKELALIDGDTVILPKPQYQSTIRAPVVYYLGIPRGTAQAELAAGFLAGFLSEDFHRAHADYRNMFYRNLDSYELIPDNQAKVFEEYMSYILPRYERIVITPDFNYWQFTELLPRHLSGELTLKQCCALLQQEAEKRLLG